MSRCENGQCIPELFFQDDLRTAECFDQSDVLRFRETGYLDIIGKPTFANEDISCSRRNLTLRFRIKLTSSCLLERDTLLEQLMFVDKENSVSDDCWSAVKCQLAIPKP
jgi:hypothetical protein